MTIDTFTSRTAFLSALLWSYSKEQRSFLRDRNQKQRLEFKMFSMAFYALNIMNDESSKLQETLKKCIEILDMTINDATYGEPMNAYSSFCMDEEYLTEKLNYYIEDIDSFLRDSNQYPKFCFNSIIKRPLENTDSYFFDYFNHKEYTTEFVQHLQTVIKLMNVCLKQPDIYLSKLKEAKDQVKLDVLDPNKDKLIAEALNDKLSLLEKADKQPEFKENPLGKLIESQFKYLAIDSEDLDFRQYYQALYEMLLKERADHKFAVSQVMQVPALILIAMRNNSDVEEYLKPYKSDILKSEELFKDFDRTSKYLIDDDDSPHNKNNSKEINSSPLEKIKIKARAFINEFDNAEFINKLSITIKFIVENTPEIASQKSALGVNDPLFKDLSDNIYLIAVSKVEELITTAQSDSSKLKQVFQEKENAGHGKTMWDEYSFLLINNSKWPLTREAQIMWSFTVLEFGQLKFANEKPVNNNSKDGCYIATMAYGDYDHPQVIELRNFRDDVLLKTVFGRLFVKTYYFISPQLVMILKRHSKTNKLIRQWLDRFIVYLKQQ